MEVLQYPEPTRSINFDALRRSLKPFILWRLRQFNLIGRCNPDEVFNEVYVRWRLRQLTGQTIHDVEAWFRGAAFNRIREINRDFQKDDCYPPTELESLVGVEDDLDTPDYGPIRRALCALPAEHRELLEMRFYGELSWEEIARIFSERDEIVSVEALRKRGQRALEQLRKKVLSTVQNESA